MASCDASLVGRKRARNGGSESGGLNTKRVRSWQRGAGALA